MCQSPAQGTHRDTVKVRAPQRFLPSQSYSWFVLVTRPDAVHVAATPNFEIYVYLFGAAILR